MTRQKILITGASSGLGAGMARQFAAKGRDLALCARRTDNLEELKSELTSRDPGLVVAVAALDVNDHEAVPKMFKKSGAGHLVLVSSVLGNKGVPGHKAAYAASNAGVTSLGSRCAPSIRRGPSRSPCWSRATSSRR